MSSHLDDLFQKHLAAGDKTSPEAPELDPLLQMASSIQQLPHPQPTSDQVRAWRVAMLAEIDRQAPQQSIMTTLRQMLSLRPARAALAVVIASILIVFAFALFSSAQPALAAGLANLNGEVAILTTGAQDWRPAALDDQLGAGTRLRTGSSAGATIVFPDGSQVALAANTEITISRLVAANGSLNIEVDQVAGHTTHQVVPFLNRSGAYEVVTPAGKASVRGTSFQVTIDSQGQSHFLVDSGEVAVTNADTTVTLTAGTATVVHPNRPPHPPLHYFTLNDSLVAVNGNFWTVGAVTIRVSDETVIDGEPVIGDSLYVVGRILPNQTWLADFITLDTMDLSVYEFTGEVQAIAAGVWQVNDKSILVNEVTEIEGEILIGDTVKITYIVLEGDRWLALKIERLDEAPVETPEPTETPEAEETPAPTETPLPGTCTGTEIHPEAQTLANRYGVPYAEIMTWFCEHHYGFGEIDLAYSLSAQTGVSVEAIFEMRAAGQGWGTIKQELSPKPTKTPKPPKPTKPPKP